MVSVVEGAPALGPGAKPRRGRLGQALNHGLSWALAGPQQYAKWPSELFQGFWATILPAFRVHVGHKLDKDGKAVELRGG